MTPGHRPATSSCRSCLPQVREPTRTTAPTFHVKHAPSIIPGEGWQAIASCGGVAVVSRRSLSVRTVSCLPAI
jgi:hypothetical protein